MLKRCERYIYELIFTTAWEQRELNSVAENVGTGRSAFISGVSESPETPYAVLGSTSVIGYDSAFDHYGDFILTARVGANAGNLYRYTGKVKISDNTVYIQGRNLDFLFCLLEKFDLKSLSFGTGQPLIKASELKSLALYYPCEEEQARIGTFFRTLDTAVTLNQRKLDGLKKLKAGYLQQMFPQTGERVPRVRFAGVTGEWVERKLGEVADINSGRDYKHLNLGNIPVYGTGGYMLSVDESLSEQDAIGIGRKGTINKPLLLKAPFWTVDTLFFAKSKKNNLNFLFSMFETINWKTYDESTGVPSLSKSTINEIVGKFPSLPEQTAVGNLFHNLGGQIAAQNQKLEQMRQLKAAYLQKMFV